MTSTSFEFVQGNERLDWGVLVSIDIHRLMKDTSVDTLQRIVENLAFARVTRDEASMFTPEHIVHLFQLAQVVIQYLVYSQECLASMNVKLSERMEELQKLLRAAEDAKAALTEENIVAKKEIKAQRRTLMAYEFNATNGRGAAASGIEVGAPPTFVCPVCAEAYHKYDSLQSHMRKRHGTTPLPPAPVTTTQWGLATGGVAPEQQQQQQQQTKVNDDVARMQERITQLEDRLEREREAHERQLRDQLMMLLLRNNGSGSAAAATTPPSSQPEPQKQQQVPSGLPQAIAPATTPPAAPRDPVELPLNVASVPIVPDIAALVAYNQSRQQETANNALVRQIVDLESEIRNLKATTEKQQQQSTSPALVAPTETRSPQPALPSWLTAGSTTTTAATPPAPVPTAAAVSSVPVPGGGGAAAAPAQQTLAPPPAPPQQPLPPPPAPVSVPAATTTLSMQASMGSQSAEQEAAAKQAANILKYGLPGPAFVPSAALQQQQQQSVPAPVVVPTLSLPVPGQQQRQGTVDAYEPPTVRGPPEIPAAPPSVSYGAITTVNMPTPVPLTNVSSITGAGLASAPPPPLPPGGAPPIPVPVTTYGVPQRPSAATTSQKTMSPAAASPSPTSVPPWLRSQGSFTSTNSTDTPLIAKPLPPPSNSAPQQPALAMPSLYTYNPPPPAPVTLPAHEVLGSTSGSLSASLAAPSVASTTAPAVPESSLPPPVPVPSASAVGGYFAARTAAPLPSSPLPLSSNSSVPTPVPTPVVPSVAAVTVPVTSATAVVPTPIPIAPGVPGSTFQGIFSSAVPVPIPTPLAPGNGSSPHVPSPAPSPYATASYMLGGTTASPIPVPKISSTSAYSVSVPTVTSHTVVKPFRSLSSSDGSSR